MAKTGNSKSHGSGDGSWYKFRSVGDNNVIQLESSTGNKLICMPENSDLNDIQLFRATKLPNGKYQIVAKCQKLPGVCQVWDYLFHRELLIVKKEDAEATSQHWVLEHAAGYNSIYLIQSSPIPDTCKCIKNMGPGKQIKLVKSSECLSDIFTRWYLEPQPVVSSSITQNPVVVADAEPVPATAVIASPAIATPAPVSNPASTLISPALSAQSTSSLFEGFKDGVWYKIRSVGDNNVIHTSVSTDGNNLICAPENNDMKDMQIFQPMLLPNGKFSITTRAKSLSIPHFWDYVSHEEQLILNLTIHSEIDKFSQNWVARSITGHESQSQCLIQPNPEPEAPESDSHKCIRNMGQGNPIQLVNQPTEGAGDSYTRWVLEPQDNSSSVINTSTSNAPLLASFPDVVVALQAKAASNTSSTEQMDTR